MSSLDSLPRRGLYCRCKVRKNATTAIGQSAWSTKAPIDLMHSARKGCELTSGISSKLYLMPGMELMKRELETKTRMRLIDWQRDRMAFELARIGCIYSFKHS